MTTAKLTQIEANLLIAAKNFGDDDLRSTIKRAVFGAAKARHGIHGVRVSANIENPHSVDYLELHVKDDGMAFGVDDDGLFTGYASPATAASVAG